MTDETKTNMHGEAIEGEQVPDHATTKLTGEEVANGAAETLHGNSAVEEQYRQPEASLLPGGSTLVSAEGPADPDKIGERRDGVDNPQPAAEQASEDTTGDSGSSK